MNEALRNGENSKVGLTAMMAASYRKIARGLGLLKRRRAQENCCGVGEGNVGQSWEGSPEGRINDAGVGGKDDFRQSLRGNTLKIKTLGVPARRNKLASRIMR
jgi:hypothetical protein